MGRRKRLKQLQFASDAKRIGDENGASATSGPATSMATMPALESETLDIVDAGSDISSNSTVSGDSDKEVIIEVFYMITICVKSAIRNTRTST